MKKLPTSAIERLSVDDFRQAKKIPVIIILDNVRSQSNIGSVFRTSDAFRIEALFLCGISATPPSREIHKTALGSTDSVKWEYFESTMEAVATLKKREYNIIGIEQAEQGKLIQNFTPVPNKKYGLILGNEVHGIDDAVMESCELCLEIPQSGTKHSLNVSVAAGIVLWEFYKQLYI
jgi:tRNA G18 (ribose-2'-O)-methylase SpoU